MEQAPTRTTPTGSGQVVNFDEVLLDASSPEQLQEIMAEAEILTRAFAADGRAAQIAALARSLQSGVRDMEFGRAHARLLAAALHRLARDAAP